MAMQSTEGKGQRWMIRAAEQVLDKIDERIACFIKEKENPANIQIIANVIAEAYSQSGAGPTDGPVACPECGVYQPGHLPGCSRHAAHLLQNLLAVIHRDGGHYVSDHGLEKASEDAEKIVVGYMAKLLSGAGSPEETGTCLVCPCGKAYRIIGGEIVELSKEQAEVMQEEAASSSQSAETTETWRGEVDTRAFPRGGGSTGERAEPSAITLENCGPENVEFNAKWHLVSANRISRYGMPYARPGEPISTANVGAWYETACYWRNEAEKVARAALAEGSTTRQQARKTSESSSRTDESMVGAGVPASKSMVEQAGSNFLAEGSRTRHCAICAENRPATCDGRCELVGSRTEKGE